MIKEEWRMHSTLYRGRSFAMFPLVIFALSFSTTYIVANFSTLNISVLGSALEGIAFFVGLSVGSLGFSSRDAMKNVLGPMNLLVYSSRTLPISQSRLLLDFIIKDIIYYTLLFLAPLALGVVIPGGSTLLMSAALTVPLFLTGILLSLVIARTSLKLPTRRILNYTRLARLKPLTAKSVLDVSRSSGGLLKILFSFTILFLFYWFAVLYFPIKELFITQPILSFSVIVGVINLSVYNWINRFDSLEDYQFLPVDRNNLLSSKKRAFVLISFPLGTAFIALSHALYQGQIILPVLTGAITSFYTLAIASRLTGLNPNEKLFSSRIFTKYLLANSLVTIPLLLLSINYQGSWIYPTALLVVLAASSFMNRDMW